MYRRIAIAVFAVATALYAQEVKTAGEAFKNVTQLKTIPADQLAPTMQFMAAALGVNCDFCHVQGKPEADDKGPKRTAREMIAMTMEINKASFRGQVQVSCFTCHRGSARPVSVPPVMESDTPVVKTENRPPAPGGPGVTADQILEKWVAAVGGADAMHKVTSRDLTGKIIVGGNESPVEVLTKAPNKRVSITHMPGGNESLTAFDGTEGWMSGGGAHQARVMSPAESAAAALDAELYLPLRLKEMYPQLRRGRPDEINGAMCDSLNASAPGKPRVSLYIDQKTGLLMRMVRYAETPVGRMPTQIDYADYRDSGGVKIPFRWTLSRPNGRFTIQIAEAKVNVPIDDTKFTKP